MAKLALPPAIEQSLSGFDSRRRWLRFKRGTAEAVIVLILLLAVAALVDLTLQPPSRWRVLLSATAYATALVVIIGRGLAPLFRRGRPAEIALSLEKAAGPERMEERLSSAVELAIDRSSAAERGVSPWMIEQIIAQAASEVSSLDAPSLVDPRPTRRTVRQATALALTVFAVCFVDGVFPLALRALFPHADVTRPASIALEVTPGNSRIAHGANLEIAAIATPEPGEVTVQVDWKDGVREEIAMARQQEAGKFRFRLPAVTQEFDYVVRAGDAQSESFHIAVDALPRLESIELEITPPTYTGLPVQTISSGDAEVLNGTTLGLSARFNDSDQLEASLLFDSGVEQPLQMAEGVGRTQWRPAATASYRLKLRSASGSTSETPRRWLVKVVPDLAPTAKLSGEGIAAGSIGLDETLLLTVQGADDVGLRKLELLLTDSQGRQHRRPIPLPATKAGEPAPRELSLPAPLDVSAMELTVADSLLVQLEVTDLAGQTTRAKPLDLTLVSPDDARNIRLAARLRSELLKVNGQLDILRQTRKSWAAAEKGFRPADLPPTRAELVLIQSKVQQLTDALVAVGERLVKEATEASLATAPEDGSSDRRSRKTEDSVMPAVHALGDSLADWAKLQRQGLLASAETAAKDDAKALPNSLASGLSQSEVAVQELDELRDKFGLLVARVEAEALVGQSQAAHSRSQRTLPVVRGKRGWDMTSWTPGLAGSFYAGKEPNGRLLLTEVGLPRFDERNMPNHGPVHWMVRYEGEILIPTAGKWAFGVRVDDGVRLEIDGKRVLPLDAWKEQPVAEYKAVRELTSGWHPIVLDMFQATGTATLRLMLAPENKPLKEVALAQLRCRGAAHADPRLLREMAFLPVSLLQTADARLSKDLAIIGSIPAGIRRMAEDVIKPPADRLDRLSKESEPSGHLLTQTASDQENWSPAALEDIPQHGATLVRAAVEARDLLMAQTRDMDRRMLAPGIANSLRREVARLRERAEQLQRTPNELSAQEKLARTQQEEASARVRAQQLDDEVRKAQKALHAEARREDSSLAERALNLAAADLLEDKVAPEIDKLQKSLEANAPEPRHRAALMQLHLRDIDRELQKVAEAEDAARRQQVSDLAKQGLDQLETLERAEAAKAETAQDEAHRELKESISKIVDLQRNAGDFKEAEKLSQRLPKTGEEIKRSATANELRQLAKRDHGVPPSKGEEIANRLQRQMERLQASAKSPESRDRIAEQMTGAELALELEAERLHLKNDLEQALANRQLAADVKQTAEQKQSLDAGKVQPLVERARALAGKKGEQAKAAEAVAARERAQQQTLAPADSAMAQARTLEELARQAELAAREKEARPELMDQLAQTAGAEATRQAMADVRKDSPESKLLEQAKALDKLAQEDAEVRAAEQEARRAFAKAERKIAGALEEVAKTSIAASKSPSDSAIAKAADQARQEIPEQAQRLRDLGLVAEQSDPAGAPPADPAKGAPTPELREFAGALERARQQAQELSELGRQKSPRDKAGQEKQADDIKKQAVAVKEQLNDLKRTAQELASENSQNGDRSETTKQGLAELAKKANAVADQGAGEADKTMAQADKKGGLTAAAKQAREATRIVSEAEKLAEQTVMLADPARERKESIKELAAAARQLQGEAKRLAELGNQPVGTEKFAGERAAQSMERQAAKLGERFEQLTRLAKRLEPSTPEVAQSPENTASRSMPKAAAGDADSSPKTLAEQAKTLAGLGKDAMEKVQQQNRSRPAKELAEQHKETANKVADEADRLARQAEMVADPAGSHSIAKQGHEAADELQQKLAMPLAEAFQKSGSKENPEARAKAAELGQRLANLAAEQRQAAEQLEQALGRKEAHRRESVGELAESAPLLKRPETDDPQAARAAEKARAQAAQIQSRARQAQRAADQAQERADRQLAQAAEKSREAKRIQDPNRQQNANRSAQQAMEQAMAAQEQALAAQREALKLHATDVAASEPLPDKSRFPLRAETASNLQKALENSRVAKENAGQAAEEASPTPRATANQQQAKANEAEARRMLAAATQDTPRELASTADRLREMASSQAESNPPRGDALRPTALAAAPKGSTAEPGPSQQLQSQAAAKALATVQRAPEKAESYQKAARSLAQAASQARMASALSDRSQSATPANGKEAPSASELAQASADASADSQDRGQEKGAAGTGEGADMAPAGIDQAEWSKLSPAARQAIRTAGIDKFSEESQEAIRAYFKRLGEAK